MARLACVNVANLPLQLLLRKHPEWRELPAAVVSKDSPYGTILIVNNRAKEYGIEPGMRYAGALSLNHDLRADTIPEETVREGADFLARELSRYSPQVETDRSEPGIYWLEVGGMSSLYPDLSIWCKAVRRCLAETGFTAAIAAGSTRFGCYAAAKSIEDQVIFPHPRSERARALAAGISVLKLPAEVTERLEMLGVRSVASFLDLPPGAVGKRFGPEVKRLHRFAAGELDIPVQPTVRQADPQWTIKLPYAELSGDRLLDTMRRSLDEVIGSLRKSHRLIRELRIRFVLEGTSKDSVLIEPIQPSSPSIDIDLLTDLIALRMENLRLPCAAAAIRMAAVTVAERSIQSELFSVASKESRQEADKVLARLRGIFGNSCVQRAVLEDEHIPERSYSWEDLNRMPWESEQDLGAPTSAGSAASEGAAAGDRRGGRGRRVVRQAVRQEVQQEARQEARQAVQVRQAVRQPTRQAVRRIFSDPCLPPKQGFAQRWGPYPISGRWWRGEQPKDYCYAETRTGEILWLCSDGSDGRWRQIGVVE
jgi:protein ImuB